MQGQGQGHAKVCQNEGQLKIYGGNAIWNKYFLSFFRCFQSDGEFIPDPGRSNRESTLAQVKFCFRHNKLLCN